MEIGNQAVNNLKLISRINKYLGPAAAGFYCTIFCPDRFQCTCTCRTDCNNLSAVFARRINLVCCFLCHRIKFWMHMMLQNVFCLYRTERSKSDMQRDTGNFNTLLLYPFQQFFCKMKTRCRCRCRTFMLCINGLVTVLILQTVCDIRWKRHLTQFIEYFFKNTVISELYHTIAFFYNIHNLSD